MVDRPAWAAINWASWPASICLAEFAIELAACRLMVAILAQLHATAGNCRQLMTPEKLAQATALSQAHVSLLAELKAWDALIEPPGLHLLGLQVQSTQAGIPPLDWRDFRIACIAHVQAAVDKNRAAFGAL